MLPIPVIMSRTPKNNNATGARNNGGGPCSTNLPSLSASSVPPPDEIDAFLSGEMSLLAIEFESSSKSSILNGDRAATSLFTQRTRSSNVDTSSTPLHRQHPAQTSQAIIARQIYQLGLQEREQAMQEVHGVVDPTEETPDFVRSSLELMDKEIQIRCDTDHAYHRALNMVASSTTRDDISYSSTAWLRIKTPESDGFRLSFLRADRFDARQAAERFLLYFKLKESLYGVHKLTQRDIRLDDLDQDCIDRMESGKVQLLPHRDARGRAVIVSVGRLFRQFEASRSATSNTISEEDSNRNEVRKSCLDKFRLRHCLLFM
jgi:hypothetical protein